MDSVHGALRLTGVPPLRQLLAGLPSEKQTVVRGILPRVPLLQLLHHLQAMAFQTEELEERRLLLDIARLAIAKHAHTAALFESLTDAVAASSLDASSELVGAVSEDDALLALEMLALASEILALAGFEEQGRFSYCFALSIADRFDLRLNRGIVLHQLGEYERHRGHRAAAEEALAQASLILVELQPNTARANNFIRARNYAERLFIENDPPAPADLEALVRSDTDVALLLVPVLAEKALQCDDLATATTWLTYLRRNASFDPDASTHYFFVEARLARRNGAFEVADLFLARARTSRHAGLFRRALLQEELYLSRDLGDEEKVQRLLKEIDPTDTSSEIRYQRALALIEQGHPDKATQLFQEILSSAQHDLVRANCLGMLALLADTHAVAVRYFCEAIGLYVKLGRAYDHAVALSHLASLEFGHAVHRQKKGVPALAISEFSRSDALSSHAEEIAESLGQHDFLVSQVRSRAVLERTRGRPRTALRHFDRAVAQIEHAYLAFSQRSRADRFFLQNRNLFSLAIDCALDANRPFDALAFTERSKARRLMRDLSEMMLALEERPDDERVLLARIQDLRSRLRQDRPLSLAERETLWSDEEALLALHPGSVRHRLDVTSMLDIIFGRHARHAEPEDESADEPVVELPGGGVIACMRCHFYNRLESTYCSACGEVQPKSAQMNMNVLLGDASEQEMRFAFGDHLYNKAVQLFHDGKPAESEHLLRQAMEHGKHPNWSFFLGLCRLTADDAQGAIAAFQDVDVQQFASGKYPFWPLPVSTEVLHYALARLQSTPERSIEVFGDLMDAYAEHSAKQKKASTKWKPPPSRTSA